jgi:hypothetical protein
VSASGGGRGAFGDSGVLEVTAGTDVSAEPIRLAASCEHPVSETAANEMTAASVTQTFPGIQRQAQLAAKCALAIECNGSHIRAGGTRRRGGRNARG